MWATRFSGMWGSASGNESRSLVRRLLHTTFLCCSWRTLPSMRWLTELEYPQRARGRAPISSTASVAEETWQVTGRRTSWSAR